MRVLFFFLILFSAAQAQIVIPSDSINTIGFEPDGRLFFCHQKTDSSLLGAFLQLKNKQWFIASHSSIDSKILQQKATFFNTKDLRTTKLSNFTGNVYTSEKEGYTIRLEFINPHLVRISTLSDMLISYQTPIELDFGNGKKAYALARGNALSYLLIPTDNKNLLYDISTSVSIRKPMSFHLKKQKEPTSKPCFSEGHYIGAMFDIQKEGKQYILIDNYGERVLPSAYDEIQFNGHFILAKKGSSLEIYNIYLQQMLFPNLKKVYLHLNALEVLDDNGAHYYDCCGEELDKPEREIEECGSSFIERWLEYRIKQTPKPYIERVDTNNPNIIKEKHYLIDRKPTEKIAFADGTTEFSGLSIEEKFPFEALRVQQGNLFGLFEYEYHKSHQLKGKQLLPIAFNKIEQDKNERILFYQNGKVGIYPQFTTPQYDVLVPITDAFYQIEKNGRKGFLDIYTLEEYF